MTPKISVCIPSYNHERYIGRTLASILSQGVDSLEVVVVDDCSTDASVARIREIDDPRIRLIVSEENAGPSVAANRAVAESSGEYVAFFGSDDEMFPDALARKAALLDANAGLGLVYSDVAIIDTESRRLGTYWESEGYSPLEGRLSVAMIASAGMFIPAMSTLIRRRYLNEAGVLDPALRYANDGDLWLRIAALAPIAYINAPLVGWRQHEHNLHRTADPASYEERSELTARVLAANPGVAPRWLRGALVANPLLQGVEPAYRRSPAEARNYLARAFRHCPYHPLLPILYANTFLDRPSLWNLGSYKRLLLKLLKPA